MNSIEANMGQTSSRTPLDEHAYILVIVSGSKIDCMTGPLEEIAAIISGDDRIAHNPRKMVIQADLKSGTIKKIDYDFVRLKPRRHCPPCVNQGIMCCSTCGSFWSKRDDPCSKCQGVLVSMVYETEKEQPEAAVISCIDRNNE